ncbi:arylsulfotransferase family protein [Conexibacter woesei]|uniref:arylsulfotransferase family protein n=1 Tax=Conexibacter woesei TaxID=191495 RepID=UPI000416F296|nr:arylsulfotransferase family protein [Conexibacter woesei]
MLLSRSSAPLGVAVAALLAVAPAVHATVAVSPLDGTPDANPATQISVLGVAPSRIAAVRAVGARSGAHSGKLKDYSGGRGASFVPARPFAAGERVAVTVRLRGSAVRALRSSFTVATLAPIPPVLNLPSMQPGKLEHFATRPDLLAPRITVAQDRSSSSAMTLMTPLPSPVIHPDSKNTVSIAPVGPGGPMIVDPHGKLVWFRPLAAPDVAANLAVQTYRGRRVLTWWQGPVTVQAFGLGEGIIADESYKTIARIRAGNGYRMDIHELRLTGDGDALVTVYSPVLVGGRPVLDSIIQRIDVATGLVVWEWHALGHVPLSESYASPAVSAANDVYHINSVQPIDGGRRLLVSARDASAIWAVDARSGRIAWRLGGRRSTFRMGPGARFWLQHDARMLAGGRVSLFDDEAGPPRKGASRGLVLQLDMKHKTAKVVASVTRAEDTSAQSEGSVQELGSGNLFVGFGAAGPFSEFTPGGRRVFDASLPDGDGSYRTLRAAWHARPTTRPDVEAHHDATTGAVQVTASWNGATEVAGWQVLADGGTAPVAAATRTGFETGLVLTGDADRVVVRALDRQGRVLGSSASVPVAAR